MTTSIIKNSVFNLIKLIVGIVFCLTLWELLAVKIDNSYFMPRIAETFSALAVLIKTAGFWKYVLISLLRVALGLTAGIIFGVVLATVCHVIPVSKSLITPLITIMKATPVATIILILWFTLSNAELAVFVVFLMVTPVIWQNVYDGYKSISKEMREVCEIFEISRFKRLRILVFPAIIKYLVPAVITSVGLAWKAEIAAEIMTYSNIGQSIDDFKTLHLDTPSVFAWAVVIVVLSLILESVIKTLLRRVRV